MKISIADATVSFQAAPGRVPPQGLSFLVLQVVLTPPLLSLVSRPITATGAAGDFLLGRIHHLQRAHFAGLSSRHLLNFSLPQPCSHFFPQNEISPPFRDSGKSSEISEVCGDCGSHASPLLQQSPRRRSQSAGLSLGLTWETSQGLYHAPHKFLHSYQLLCRVPPMFESELSLSGE